MALMSLERAAAAIDPYKFRLFLLVLVLFFVVVPFFDAVIVNIAASLIPIFAVYAISTNKKIFAVSIVLALLSLGAFLGSSLVQYRWLFGVGAGLDLIFFALVATLILSVLFRAKRVTVETVAGAICVYVILGLIWGDAFAILATVNPQSFAGGAAAIDQVTLATPRYWISHFNYFSFVTLTTLGYGDITPITREARSLATLEAITGQLYLAVLIARLVSQYVSSGRSASE